MDTLEVVIDFRWSIKNDTLLYILLCTFGLKTATCIFVRTFNL